MAESFEKYLYRKFRAVHAQGFSELASNKKGIHLLDILIKTESEGMFPRRPVLKKAGSMIDLGTESSAEVQNILREGLADFESEDPIGMICCSIGTLITPMLLSFHFFLECPC